MANKGTALISGVNGFIAAQVAAAFLRTGWAVRGTVRNAPSAARLRQVLKKEGLDANFEVVEVADITADGAFDSAVEGVDTILHLASHVSFAQVDPEPVIKVAAGGTESILKSALNHAGPQLKSIILASSVLSIWEPNRPGYVFTESDWNTYASEQVKKLGKDTPGNLTYMASKTAAEKAFWAFRDEFKPKFAMAAINPALVFGPPLFLPDDPEKLSISVKPIWQIFSGHEVPPPVGGSGASVDVRDVARLFLFAAESPDKANGQRYLAAGGIAQPQAIADILNKAFPARNLQKGHPGEGYSSDLKPAAFDASRAVKATGRDWIDLHQTIVDTAKALDGYS